MQPDERPSQPVGFTRNLQATLRSSRASALFLRRPPLRDLQGKRQVPLLGIGSWHRSRNPSSHLIRKDGLALERYGANLALCSLCDLSLPLCAKAAPQRSASMTANGQGHIEAQHLED